MQILRRIRGLIGLALAWSIAWIPLGLALFVAQTILRQRAIPWEQLPELAVRLGVVGGACGFAFGIVIALAERHRQFQTLTFARMATWGALGGLLFPAVLIGTRLAQVSAFTAVSVISVYGALGALSSVGTLAIARRAPAIADGDSPLHIRS